MSGISRESGLSHSHVKTIFKDSEGFLWFGTFDGLNRYDGVSCKRYLYEKTPGTQYQNKIIHSIYEDSSGYLWFGTSDINVFRFDHINDAFWVYSLPVKPDLITVTSFHVFKIIQDQEGVLWFGTSQGLYYLTPYNDTIASFKPWNDHFSGEIEALLSDKNGNLWLGTKGSGLYKISDDKVQPILQEVISKFVTNILEDDNGELWIASAGGGLYCYFPSSGLSRQFLVNNEPAGSLPNLINKIIPWENTGFILATYGGIYVFDKLTEKYSEFSSQVSFPRYPKNLAFNDLYLDDQNVLWAATQALGVYKYYLFHDAFSHIIPFPNSINQPENTIHDILEGNQNIVYLASESGLVVGDRKTGSFQKLTPPGIASQQFVITKLYRLAKDSILIATWNQGLWVYNPEKDLFSKPGKSMTPFKNAQIFEVFHDRDDHIWIGLHEEGLLKLNRKLEMLAHYRNTSSDSPISGTSVRKILQDVSGKLWIGHLSSGIDILDPKTGEYRNIVNDYLGKSPISNNDIMSLMEDSRGNIWIGTNGGGVNLYIKESDEFVHLTEKDGLINDVIFSIMEDAQGNIWLQTNRGITRLNYYTSSSLPIPLARNFDIEDGLPNTNFIFSSSLKGKDGEFYFPSRYGVICFYPEMLAQSDKAPNIVITQIEINNKPFTEYFQEIKLNPEVRNATYVESMVLKHSLNRVSIEFAALDYFKPADNQYIVKLEGFDQEWITLGNNRKVSYINLPSGNYTLYIKAGNSHNIWNETGISLQININPPWWLTWWAFILYAFIFMVIIALIRYFAIRKERIKAKNKFELLKLEKELELDKFKLDFFTKITHEIRTPITLIKAPIEKLMQNRGTHNKDEQKYFKILKSNSEKLYQLCNMILDLRKIDENSFSIHKVTEDLIPLLKAIKDRFQSFAESKNITLSFTSNYSTIYWEFDISVIDRIVSNLLSNAIKFTKPKGKVILACNLIKEVDQLDVIIIEVTDTGIGFDSRDMTEIFKPFYQSRNVNRQDISGTGLGLTLVKELTDLHQGHIMATSKLGKGSVFQIHFTSHLSQLDDFNFSSLVSKTDSTIKVHQTNEIINNSNHKKKERILIVEDNKELNEFMITILGDIYNVTSCFTGTEGFSKALELIPDIIISDIMMPDMNGFDMCQKIKKEPLTCHIPLILLTALSSDENQKSGFEVGADDYLSKPFDTSILLMKVRNLLNLKSNIRLQFAKKLLIQTSDDDSEETLDPLITKIIGFIENNLDDSDLSIHQLQREIGIGRSQLFLKIKDITGMTVSKLMQVIRLKKAYGYIITGKYTISETAYMVGFKNISHFTRLFKDNFGIAPSELMKNKIK